MVPYNKQGTAKTMIQAPPEVFMRIREFNYVGIMAAAQWNEVPH
jgi:hypothetical protein